MSREDARRVSGGKTGGVQNGRRGCVSTQGFDQGGQPVNGVPKNSQTLNLVGEHKGQGGINENLCHRLGTNPKGKDDNARSKGGGRRVGKKKRKKRNMNRLFGVIKCCHEK